MGDVIRLPQPIPELEELRDFGAVGDLSVTLIREKGNDAAPLTLALVGDEAWGLHSVMSFKPEGRALAEIVGSAVVKALRVAGR
jgi:hypothetical protein